MFHYFLYDQSLTEKLPEIESMPNWKCFKLQGMKESEEDWTNRVNQIKEQYPELRVDIASFGDDSTEKIAVVSNGVILNGKVPSFVAPLFQNVKTTIISVVSGNDDVPTLKGFNNVILLLTEYDAEHVPSCISFQGKDEILMVNSPSTYTTWRDVASEWKEMGEHIFFASEDGNNSICFRYGYNPVMKSDNHFGKLLEKQSFWERLILPAIKFGNVDTLSTNPATAAGTYKMYAAAFRKSRMKEVESLRSEIETTRRTIQDNIQNISRWKIELDNKVMRLSALEKGTMDRVSAEKFKQEFDTIIVLPYVQDLIFSDKGLNVVLEPIMIRDDPRLTLGPYIIALDVFNNKITVENTVNPRDGHAHPHIPQKGNPCFGSYSDIFYHLGNGDINAVVEMMHRYLQEVNIEDSWGQRVLDWNVDAGLQIFKEEGREALIPWDYNERYHQLFDCNLPGCEPVEETEEEGAF